MSTKTSAMRNIPDQKAFYLNSLYSILIQIEYEPQIRNSMFQSLIDFGYGAKNLSSLETVFLTLLNHACTQKHGSQNGLFQRGLKTWTRFANSNQRVEGASPIGFYNVTSKKMILFSTQTANAIRAGQIDLSSCQDIGKTLENKAEYDAADAFSRASAENGILHFHLVGQPDTHNLIGLLIGAAVVLAILLYASDASLLPAKPRKEELEGDVANVAAVPIVIGSLQNNDKFEEMTDALKGLDSTITELSAEKEVKGTILVMDGEGHVNISGDSTVVSE